MAKLKPEYINPHVQIKMFRTQLRGVTDPLFFIFRLCKLFA